MSVHHRMQRFLLSHTYVLRLLVVWPDAAFLIFALGGNLRLRALILPAIGLRSRCIGPQLSGLPALSSSPSLYHNLRAARIKFMTAYLNPTIVAGCVALEFRLSKRPNRFR
jgi:hypothetical protein